jgi:hypothetical protein
MKNKTVAAAIVLAVFTSGCAAIKTAYENSAWERAGIELKHYVSLEYRFDGQTQPASIAIILEPVRSIAPELPEYMRRALSHDELVRMKYRVYMHAREAVEQEVLTADRLDPKAKLLIHHTARYENPAGLISPIIFDPPLEDSFRQHLHNLLASKGVSVMEVDNPRHITVPQKRRASFILAPAIYWFYTGYAQTGTLSQRIVARGPVQYDSLFHVGLYLLDPKTREIIAYNEYEAHAQYDTEFASGSLARRNEVEETAISRTIGQAWTDLMESIATDRTFSAEGLISLAHYKSK